ncbi:MAG: hypothetical protein HQL38_07905 [Alphaproteobacteria bacterium]|nr:hypothetical protein [Alphaproteobacteria bacterium]
MPRLMKWSIVGDFLWGAVEDDSRFTDGDVVCTSKVVRVGLNADGEPIAVTKSGTEYVLEGDSDSLSVFENAGFALA